MKDYDVVILTESRYKAPKKITPYIANILEEERLLASALEKRGFSVCREDWADPDFDWSKSRMVIFRTTWNYANHFEKFMSWMEEVRHQTRLINPYELILWNIDKHYLRDLHESGIHIPPSCFIEKGDARSLEEIQGAAKWDQVVLKPAIGGGARHTFRIQAGEVKAHEAIYRDLIREESMILQEFQEQVITKGEITLMVFGGRFSHAILKRAKAGDFRVQDDFGGKVYAYEASREEIAFAEQVVAAVKPTPLYARVDAIWDNNDQLAVSELELIEPELWFRFHHPAADILAESMSKLV